MEAQKCKGLTFYISAQWGSINEDQTVFMIEIWMECAIVKWLP